VKQSGVAEAVEQSGVADNMSHISTRWPGAEASRSGAHGPLESGGHKKCSTKQYLQAAGHTKLCGLQLVVG
jgi:hypothetical protein